MPADIDPTNVLVICVDEHNRNAMGCAGHPLVSTPNIDRLARRGTRFTNAYTSSPICVPARASLATGLYVHQCRAWSSAEPFDGSVRGWAQRLRDAGHRVVSVGKLHYRSSEDPNGFDPEIVPMHVYDGIGWSTALLRERAPVSPANARFARDVGWGHSEYTAYDCEIADAACDWLHKSASERSPRPWALFVSFVSPHYPLIAPEQYEELYPLDKIEMPVAYEPAQRRRHAAVAMVERALGYDYFESEEHVLLARAAYYGLCSFADAQIGRLLAALEASGQSDRTRIILTSDHGEMLGNQGLWGKSVMFEDSAGIPMIVAGPDIPACAAVDTPVSLVDCHPTIIDAAGVPPEDGDELLPGVSLIDLAVGARPDRTVLSEYHDGGSPTGMFMVRCDRWKYVCYPGYPPELFDLDADPSELQDLGQDPEFADVRRRCESRLRTVCDPEEVNAAAFADQAQRLTALGGEAAVLAAGDFHERQSHTPVPTTAA